MAGRISRAIASNEKYRMSLTIADIARMRREATIKANKLLEDSLTPLQKISLQYSKEFYVISSKGRRFNIKCQGGLHGPFPTRNIHLTVGNDLYRFCLHINDINVPFADTYLAQKLLIESDEDYFLHLASRYRVSPLGLVCEYFGIPHYKKINNVPVPDIIMDFTDFTL
jgi:hypothetical protein